MHVFLWRSKRQFRRKKGQKLRTPNSEVLHSQADSKDVKVEKGELGYLEEGESGGVNLKNESMFSVLFLKRKNTISKIY